MPPLTIQREEQNGWIILHCTGEIGLLTFQDFEDALMQIALEQPATQLKLDFKDLTRINSVALGLMAATYSQLRRHGGQMKVINLSDSLRAIMNALSLPWMRDEEDDEGLAGAAVRR